MASVKKRPDGKWRARYRDPDGKERAQHFTTRAAADKWVREQSTDVDRGTWIDPEAGKTTFKEYAEAWRKLQPHRPATALRVEKTLERHVYPALGRLPLSAIRRSHIQAWVKEHSPNMAATSLEVAFSYVATICKAAVGDQAIRVSPCAGVKLPTAPQVELRLLTTEEVEAITTAVPRRYRALVITAAGSGLRPGELFGLCQDRVDFLRRTVTVSRQLLMPRVKGETAQLSTLLKTESSYRTVPVGKVVIDAIAAHIAEFGTGPNGLVFTNENGAPIIGTTFPGVWRSAVTRAGVAGKVRLHDCRHFYASLLISTGHSVKAVQARLGHKSAVTTLDTYGHLWPDDEDRTRKAVDTALKNLADQTRTKTAS